MDALPFSQAAQNNRAPILERLRAFLDGCASVLEVGAGTGQHAVHFAEALPDLTWQATEHPQALATLRPRVEAAALPNLPSPQALDIDERPWDVAPAGAIYTANTLHIVGEDLAEAFFAGAATAVAPDGLLIVYGPFNYNGAFTSDSNARFDAWLRERDGRSGILDFEAVNAWAEAGGFRLREDCTMPANNRLLCWERS